MAYKTYVNALPGGLFARACVEESWGIAASYSCMKRQASTKGVPYFGTLPALSNNHIKLRLPHVAVRHVFVLHVAAIHIRGVAVFHIAVGHIHVRYITV